MLNTITIHPAIVECRRLYDMERDNTAHERAFMSNVGAIVGRTGQTRRVAKTLWGEKCPAYTAACYLARRQEEYDLTQALNRYDEYVAGRELPCLFTMQL